MKCNLDSVVINARIEIGYVCDNDKLRLVRHNSSDRVR